MIEASGDQASKRMARTRIKPVAATNIVFMVKSGIRLITGRSQRSKRLLAQAVRGDLAAIALAVKAGLSA